MAQILATESKVQLYACRQSNFYNTYNKNFFQDQLNEENWLLAKMTQWNQAEHSDSFCEFNIIILLQKENDKCLK